MVFDFLNSHIGDQHLAAITLDWWVFGRWVVSASLQPHGLYFQLLQLASFGDDNPKTSAVLCTMIVKLKPQVTPEKESVMAAL